MYLKMIEDKTSGTQHLFLSTCSIEFSYLLSIYEENSVVILNAIKIYFI